MRQTTEPTRKYNKTHYKLHQWQKMTDDMVKQHSMPIYKPDGREVMKQSEDAVVVRDDLGT